MIEINLLPEELRKKEGLKLSLPDLPIQKILAIFFAVFFAIQVALSAYAVYQKMRVSRLEKELEVLVQENGPIKSRKSELGAVRVRLKEAQDLTERKFFWSRLLNAVSDSVTKGVWLINLTVREEAEPSDAPRGKPKKKRSLSIEGSAVGQGQETATIGKFIKELKENPVLSELFEDIKLSNINQKKIRELDVYDFALICIAKKDKF